MRIALRPKTIQTLASATTTIVEILVAISQPSIALPPTQKSFLAVALLWLTLPVPLHTFIEGSR